MRINVRYFASILEGLGVAQENIDVSADCDTVGKVLSHLLARGATWQDVLGATPCLRMACDQEMCRADRPVREGSEIAFFPPMTGG